MKQKHLVSMSPPETRADRTPLRWSGHLPLAIRIVLSGKDEHGRTFTESTQTLGVDRRGARILTSHVIGLGAEVAVENRAVGRIAKAKVVWRGDDMSPQKAAEVVVELIEPSESARIWGIRFPSRNDKKPTLPATSRAPQPPASGENAREGSSVARPENGELIPTTVSPGAASQTLRVGPVDELGVSLADIKGSASPILYAVEPEPGADSPAEWADLSAELESLTSSRGQGRSLETPVPETASAALATLQDQAERLRQSVDEAVGSASLAAEKAVAELRAAREETEASLRTRAEDYDRRLAEISASSIEDLQRRSESLCQSFQQKMQAALDDLQQKGADQTAAVAQSAESAAQSIQRASDEMLAKLQEERLEAARALDEQTAAVGRGAESAARSIQVASDEILAKLQEERLEAAHALEEQTAAVARSAESAAQSIQLGSSEALAKLQEERLHAARTLEEQTAAVSRSAESAAQSIQLASSEALARLEAAGRQTEAVLEAGADGFRQQLADLSAAEIAGLQRQADALLETFQSQLPSLPSGQALENTLQEFQQKVAQQVTDQVPAITRDLLDRSANQLQKQVDDMVGKLGEELKAAGIALVDETREQIAALTRASLESLSGEAQALDEASRHQLAQAASQSVHAAVDAIKLATEEAVTALQAAQEKAQASAGAHAEQYEKRLAELSASGIEELERNAGPLLESFRGRLESAVNDLRQARAAELSDELQRDAEAFQERCLERLSNELKTSGMALVDETGEQITALTRASLESLSGEAQALDEASRHQLAQTASQSVHAAVDAIKLATEEAVTTFQAAQEKAQARAGANAEQYEKRLAELSASGVEELERSAGGLLESFRDRLESAVNGLHQASATDLSDQLRKVAEASQERYVEQLQKQAADALKASNDELQACHTALVDETRERTAAMVMTTLESLSSKVRVLEEEARAKLDQTASLRVERACDSIALAGDEGVARLQAQQTAAQAGLCTQTDECTKRLGELSTSSVEEFGLMAHQLREKFQGELQSTLDDFHRQGTTELTDRIQKFAGDLEQRSVGQLQRQADDALKSLSDELRTYGAQLVEEARRQLADTAQGSRESLIREVKAASEEWRSEFGQTVSNSAREVTDSLSVAEEQAVARLQAAQEEAAAGFANDAKRERERLADLSTSGSEELQRTADSILQGFSHSLKEKARATSEQAGDQLREMLQQVATSSLRESESKHEALVKQQRRIFQDNIDLAGEATLTRLTEKLTGLEQAQRRSAVSKLALALLALAPTILFVYFSTRPVMRLRVDPPAEFLAAIGDVAPPRQATEERVARAYWDWAYLHLQHKYSFATHLPEDPPVEMTEVEGKDFPTGLQAELTKRRYWRKLREIWAMPQAWEKSSLWELK